MSLVVAPLRKRRAGCRSVGLACPPPAAMDDGLLLTLRLDGVAEGSAEEKHAADAFIAGLVAELQDLEGVEASCATGEEAEPGTKALGPLLLGMLTAEVNGELLALKVVRFLCGRLQEQGQPIRLTLTRKGGDGAEVAVQLEGSARDQAAMAALLSQAEEAVRRLS